MTEVQWFVVIPLLLTGAACLFLTAKHMPKGTLLLIGCALHLAGRILCDMFPVVADGNTGVRCGTFIQRSMPDVSAVLQLLGFIAIIHGLIQVLKRNLFNKNSSEENNNEKHQQIGAR